MLEEKHVSLAAIAPVKTALAEHENREVLVLAALLAAHLSGRRLRERRTMAGLASTSFVPVGLDLRTAAEAMAATSAESCRSVDALARDATAAVILAELFDGEINVFRMTQRVRVPFGSAIAEGLCSTAHGALTVPGRARSRDAHACTSRSADRTARALTGRGAERSKRARTGRFFGLRANGSSARSGVPNSLTRDATRARRRDASRAAHSRLVNAHARELKKKALDEREFAFLDDSLKAARANAPSSSAMTIAFPRTTCFIRTTYSRAIQTASVSAGFR